MASQSKEEVVLKLILENSPLKEWHFEQILKEVNVTRLVANKWLKKYTKLGMLKRIKEKGRFPFFTVGINNSVYYSLKRIYVLEQFNKSGMIPNLLDLKDAKTVIIFGSFIKGDWYKDSDIDIFVLGNIGDFDKSVYELKLARRIEMHVFENKKEIQDVKTGLIRNVINGYLIKGQIQDIVEVS